MAIRFKEEENLFVLETKNTAYQILIGDYGVLQHLYYGKRVGDCNLEYLVQMYDRGFSGQIPEAGNRREFSTDTLLQEYSAYGTGDYRTETLRIVDENGGYGADLRYESHCIYKGKYEIPGLPAMYSEENEADTLEITLRDSVTGLAVVLYYGVYRELDIITRAARIRNEADQTLKLEKAGSACLELPGSRFDLIGFHGKHAMEREWERLPIRHGVQSVGSVRGMSSHHHNPFVILCDREATEEFGDCYAMSFVYSGNFLAEVEVDQIGQTRWVMGIHPTQFLWTLEPGDSFETPEVVMSYSSTGLSTISHTFHKAYRNHLCRGNYKLSERPVLINNWEATYFKFDEEKLLQIAEKAKELGVELFVLDDGWFGKREDDTSGLGDWTVNEAKIKGGLKKLSEHLHDIGMKFGLWFEPEAVSEDSELYREHPDWCLSIPNRRPNRSRFELILDMSRSELREYLYEKICQVLDSASIEYIKWDMNRSLSDVWSARAGKNRQGEVFHRYVLGLYELLEKLIQRYPGILLEGCAGGGGRFDAGMLYYTPQIWCSDNTDAVERLSIQYGTSFGYPVSAVGSHVSVCPNHQTGRCTSLDTRAAVAMAGSFGYELDVNKLSQEEKEEVRQQIRTYKKYQRLIFNGVYDRLSNPYKEEYAAWQITDEDQSEMLVTYVLTKKHANAGIHYLKLRNLDETSLYKEENSKKIYTGAALMYAGLPMPREIGEYDAVQMHFLKMCK